MPFVEVLVLRGASPSSVAITFEVLDVANRLRRAAGRPDAFRIRASGSGASAARAFVGLKDVPAGDREPQVVIVPGLALADEAAVAEGLARRDAQQARRRLRRAAAGGAEIASSCSAVFLVASAGLLDGRRATTSWWLAPLFRRLYPQVLLDTDAMVITDQAMTTAGAAMAQLDLVLSVISRHAEPALAERCARYLLLEQRSSQARYMAISFLSAADERVSRAERWARGRLHESFSVGELAAAAGLAARTFARRLERATGMSPVRFVQRLRVERAVEMLETTRLPFEEIARRVGYADPSTLRRHRATGAREIRNAA